MSPVELDDTVPLPSSSVDVVERGGRARNGWVRCVIGQHLCFSVDTLQSYCFAGWDPVIFDGFLFAAAVEFCDRRFRRPASGWGRQIHLRLPVHDVHHWSSTAVASELVNCLEFLTGDKWTLEFKSRKEAAPRPVQCQFQFSLDASGVIPFSDGLDSRAVACLQAAKNGMNLIHVRVGSASARCAGIPAHMPFAAIPYRVHLPPREAIESSARSRGFKFTLISGMAAHIAKVPEIVLPESGQGALGSTLVPVGQAYPDYRNHPFFTRRMERVMAALMGGRAKYTLPRLWNTKGETLREYVEIAADRKSFAQTRSCWQDQRHSSVEKSRRQCGICAACMLRRMSVHAAGLSEPSAAYVWENLSAASFAAGAAKKLKPSKKGAPRQREYAIGGVLYLDHLADLGRSEMHNASIERNATMLGQSLGQSPEGVEKKLRGLLLTHEKEWTDFLTFLGEESFIRHWCRR